MTEYRMHHGCRRVLVSVAFSLLSFNLAVSFGESLPDAALPRSVEVALYAGKGTSSSIKNVERALASDERLRVTKIDVDEIRAGRLANFDVLVHRGGSGGGQGRALGDDGRSEIRKFVEQGGGYIGVCAGAYLATCDYDWSLDILDARVVDREHWARGFGQVDIALTQAGRSRLKVDEDRLSIYYHQGPLLAPANNPEIDDYEPLATFDGEIAKNGAPSGVMPGTTAIAAGRHGAGSVICFSPHPEKTTEHEELLVKSVWLAARTKRISSPVIAEKPFPEGIRVAIYDHSPGTANGPKSLRRILTQESGFVCRTVTPADIQAGKLAVFDVLIMPGGSGSKQAEMLGVVGRENVRRFVRTGGGYVGICAGSYLATTYYPWSLRLLNANVVDREHWARGTGTVSIGFTEFGRDAFNQERSETSAITARGLCWRRVMPSAYLSSNRLPSTSRRSPRKAPRPAS